MKRKFKKCRFSSPDFYKKESKLNTFDSKLLLDSISFFNDDYGFYTYFLTKRMDTNHINRFLYSKFKKKI